MGRSGAEARRQDAAAEAGDRTGRMNEQLVRYAVIDIRRAAKGAVAPSTPTACRILHAWRCAGEAGSGVRQGFAPPPHHHSGLLMRRPAVTGL